MTKLKTKNLSRDSNQVFVSHLNFLEAPKALDEEDARFIEEKKRVQSDKEKLTRDQISKELSKFEAEVKQLNEIPKEDLEKKQGTLFKHAVFAKKRKELDSDFIVEMEIQPRKELKLEKSPKSVKKPTRSLVQYDSE
jgi:hypothetical protein